MFQHVNTDIFCSINSFNRGINGSVIVFVTKTKEPFCFRCFDNAFSNHNSLWVELPQPLPLRRVQSVPSGGAPNVTELPHGGNYCWTNVCACLFVQNSNGVAC